MSTHGTQTAHSVEETKTHESTTEEATAPSFQEQIAILAYTLWEERGCPNGSPEVDWLHAEQQLKSKTAHQHDAA